MKVSQPDQSTETRDCVQTSTVGHLSHHSYNTSSTTLTHTTPYTHKQDLGTLTSRSAGSSSYEPSQSIIEATVVDSMTESTGVDQTPMQAVVDPPQPACLIAAVDKALMDPQKMPGSTSEVVCPVEPPSSRPEKRPSAAIISSDFKLLYCTFDADSAVPVGYWRNMITEQY